MRRVICYVREMCRIDDALLVIGMQMEMGIAPVPNEYYGYCLVRLFGVGVPGHTCCLGARGLIKSGM